MIDKRRVLSLGLAAMLLFVSFSCSDNSIGDTDPPPAHNGEIGAGRGVFTFNGFAPQANKPMRVFYHNPGAVGEDLPIFIVLHGNGRTAESYRNNMAPHAQRLKFLLIVPEFNTTNFPGSRTYHQGNVLTSGGVPIAEDQWSFSLIEPLFDYVKADVGSQRDRYFLYGFSAGGQFTHRFNWHKAGNNRAEAIIFGAAGYYTLPDWDINYPYGLDQTVVTEDMVKEGLAQKRYVLVGADDNFQDGDVVTTPEANAQGAFRVDRAKNFMEKCEALANEKGWAFNWEYIEVPGVAHSNGGVAATVADLLFGGN